MAFSEIPILDLSEARSEQTKPAFLEQLRNALFNVGFLYIKNTGIDQDFYDQVCEQGIGFFDLPDEEKDRIDMVNQNSFLGYTKLGLEVTARKQDWREQVDFSTPHPLPKASDPIYYNLLAPNQWPREELLPGFRKTYERYMHQMSEVSMFFTQLIAESLKLPPTAFDKFFDADQQHKLKIITYPATGDGTEQGVGPHKDSMLSSYLLQASNQRGLQVQNALGDWIDVPPIKGTQVVAIGQGMEALTDGVCTSTTHRVLSPPSGAGARYSIAFFQGVSYDAEFEAMEVPEHVRALRNDTARSSDVEMTFVKGKWAHLGEATLANRIKSHPNVGERWYPDMLKQIREEEAIVREKADQARKGAELRGNGVPPSANGLVSPVQ